MYIVHVALQGCLKAEGVQYGLTPDTGGHIKYLLELVDACASRTTFSRNVIVTRRFISEFGEVYADRGETIGPNAEIVRLPTTTAGYLAKEDLASEVASFAESLGVWIEGQPTRPDFIHAHYADAAKIAVIIKARLGIPFVFTAHSLGRVKLQAMKSAGSPATIDARLAERIETEEQALRGADLIVASSRDEAEVQYATYGAYEPGRIRIVTPGSDLKRFADASTTPAVEQMLARFLTAPQKPPILAIARPVRKKNLPGLVEAYGRSPVLRQTANLVLVAGCRGDVSALDPEAAEEVRTIFDLIDRYDLYGQVAYPKRHETPDVPALYAYARERHGVFVNPALNEPFGLTLLEAAASGLPLVATDSGGPNDIIETCRNGLLVDPRSPDAIAAACEIVLRDRDLWHRYAAAGSVAIRAFDWAAHAGHYEKLLRSLAPVAPGAPAVQQLLVCDIDNTLVGSAPCVAKFCTWHRRQNGLAFGVATGRSFHSAMSILEQQNAPSPLVMITSVGSEIYHRDANGTTFTQDREWQSKIAAGWNRDGVLDALADIPDLMPQAPLEQRRFKISYFTNGDAGIVKKVKARLIQHGSKASVIHSHGRYLDILPVGASKGAAIDHVRHRFGLSPAAVFAAGDSGNDIEMLRTVAQSIIVANYSDGLAERADLAHSYVARRPHASGIIEGVAHFRRYAASRELPSYVREPCGPLARPGLAAGQ